MKLCDPTMVALCAVLGAWLALGIGLLAGKMRAVRAGIGCAAGSSVDSLSDNSPLCGRCALSQRVGAEFGRTVAVLVAVLCAAVEAWLLKGGRGWYLASTEPECISVWGSGKFLHCTRSDLPHAGFAYMSVNQKKKGGRDE